MKEIWIDIDSGTWGDLDTIRVCSVNNADLNFLEYASDGEIQDFGSERGGTVQEWS